MHKFFDTSGVTHPVIRDIAANIFAQEQQKPFVEEFVSYAGYPIWEKGLVIKAKHSGLSTLKRGSGANAEVILIPLALAG